MLRPTHAARFCVVFAVASGFSILPSPAFARDVLVLKNGSTVEGEVRDLGGNRVQLKLASGSKEILRRDIESATFDASRRGSNVADRDFIVRTDNHRIYGEITLLSGGRRVQVRLPTGSKTVIPRDRVARIVRKGDALHSERGIFTAELRAEIDDALSRVVNADPKNLKTIERLLIETGIFSIEKVRARLEALPDDATAARDVLHRVDRAYRFREAISTALEEAEPRLYDIFLFSEAPTLVEQKRDFLIFAFQRYAEDSVPLALALAAEPREDPSVRSWCIEFLRRTSRNRELISIYESSVGQTQLAAAIALGKNQILVGIPSLIEALSLSSEAVRGLASSSLRAFTSENFGFHPKGAPAARKEAIDQWGAWWKENEERLVAQAKERLLGKQVASKVREEARRYWQEAAFEVKSGRYARAETFLREAIKIDPTFFPAHLNLAVILYSYLGETDQASELLERLKENTLPGVTFQDHGWTYLHLGNCYRLQGRWVAAEEAYSQCVARQPKNIEALYSLAESQLAVATQAGEVGAADRKLHLDTARKHYQRVLKLLENSSQRLVTLRHEDLPMVEELPFDRREFNLSVFAVRKDARLRAARVRFDLAKIDALVGTSEAVMISLGALVGDIALEKGAPWRELETDVRVYLGLLFERTNKPRLALRQYRAVLDRLDPERRECVSGMERLRRRLPAGDDDQIGN